MMLDDDAELKQLLAEFHDTIVELIALVPRQLHMTPDTKQEFLLGVEAKLTKAIRSFNRQRRFRPWCKEVLHNFGVDLIKRHARDKKRQDALVLRKMNDQIAFAQASCSRPEPDDSDRFLKLATILEKVVKSRDRVIVGIDFQLLHELANDRVNEWLIEAELPLEFPWQRLELIPAKNARRADLARQLGGSRGWLRLRIKRALDKLKKGLSADQSNDWNDQ